MSLPKKKLSGAQNRKRKVEKDAAARKNSQPITQFLRGIIFQSNKNSFEMAKSI